MENDIRIEPDGSEEEAAKIAALEAGCDEWDGLALENDRTERLLREMGVCEF